jgi:CRISPR-associated protein Csx3
MTTYNVELNGNILKVGFNEFKPAQNDEIAKDAAARLDELVANQELKGGELLKINGPASLPVAFVIAHKVSHLYGALAVWDPKMSKYVVAISHNPDYPFASLID